ncbi:MAG: hypothetical protein ACRDGH_11665 [Candidatus Limnocylindria bacterium]
MLLGQWGRAGATLLDVNLLGAVPAGTWGDDPSTEPIYLLGPTFGTSYSLRREDGQLVLMHIPGS